MRSIGVAIYLIIGILIAATKDYLGEISGIGDIINLLLAIVLWPLVLLGVKFNLRLGGGRDDRDALQAYVVAGPALIYLRTAIGSLASRLSRMRIGDQSQY